MQQTDVIQRAVSVSWTEVNPRVISTHQADANSRTVSVQWMGGNPRVGIVRSRRQILIKVKVRIEDLPATEEVLTIFWGPHKAGTNLHAY